jgi:hypothetical protein
VHSIVMFSLRAMRLTVPAKLHTLQVQVLQNLKVRKTNHNKVLLILNVKLIKNVVKVSDAASLL